MTNEELEKYINQHGRLVFKDKIGRKIKLFGYIREVGDDYLIWQDNEELDKFKLKNITDPSFDVMKLPIIK